MKTTSFSLLAGGTLLAVFLVWRGAPSAAQQPVAQPARVAPARPAAPVAATSRAADEAAIRKTGQDFVAAFDKGDAAAIAAQWTDQGEFHSDTGEDLYGKAAIEKSYVEFFKATPKSKIELDIANIRFPSQDTALETGTMRLIPAGPELPTSTQYSVLHAREGGVWKVALAREWGGGVDKLEDLNWLTGTWKATAQDQTTELKFDWNAGKTLLKCTFSRKDGDKVVSSGTQTIGIDPQSGQLRSWTHDEAGGRGESAWFRDGNRWVAAASGVSAGGDSTQALNTITRLNNDEILWRSVERSVNGQPVPPTDPVKLTRVK